MDKHCAARKQVGEMRQVYPPAHLSHCHHWTFMMFKRKRYSGEIKLPPCKQTLAFTTANDLKLSWGIIKMDKFPVSTEAVVHEK